MRIKSSLSYASLIFPVLLVIFSAVLTLNIALTAGVGVGGQNVLRDICSGTCCYHSVVIS